MPTKVALMDTMVAATPVPMKKALVFAFPVPTKVASMVTMTVASPVPTKKALVFAFLVLAKVALMDTIVIVTTTVLVAMKWRAVTTRGVS
jgi:hypothetical protein